MCAEDRQVSHESEESQGFSCRWGHRCGGAHLERSGAWLPGRWKELRRKHLLPSPGAAPAICPSPSCCHGDESRHQRQAGGYDVP